MLRNQVFGWYRYCSGWFSKENLKQRAHAAYQKVSPMSITPVLTWIISTTS